MRIRNEQKELALSSGLFYKNLETGIATKQFEYLITRMNLSRRPPDKGGFFVADNNL